MKTRTHPLLRAVIGTLFGFLMFGSWMLEQTAKIEGVLP